MSTSTLSNKYLSSIEMLHGKSKLKLSVLVLTSAILYSPLIVKSPSTVKFPTFKVCSKEILVISAILVLKLISFLNGTIFFIIFHSLSLKHMKKR